MKRPVFVTVLACVYLAVGAVGFAAHFRELVTWQQDAVWVELAELVAILCGAFLLRGQNWARWLALVWIAFHVVLSMFRPFRELAIHGLFFAVIAWILFRSESGRYFHGMQVGPT